MTMLTGYELDPLTERRVMRCTWTQPWFPQTRRAWRAPQAA